MIDRAFDELEGRIMEAVSNMGFLIGEGSPGEIVVWGSDGDLVGRSREELGLIAGSGGDGQLACFTESGEIVGRTAESLSILRGSGGSGTLAVFGTGGQILGQSIEALSLITGSGTAGQFAAFDTTGHIVGSTVLGYSEGTLQIAGTSITVNTIAATNDTKYAIASISVDQDGHVTGTTGLAIGATGGLITNLG
jgi:hypothetical protein